VKPFITLDGFAVALPLENVDTDKILPGRFLKTTTRDGLGAALFWDMRQDSNCVFNRPPWNRASILISGQNFGCGSSREHAPWALLDFGITCIIAPSIADIFYNNCFRNGILPIQLAAPTVASLIKLADQPKMSRMVIELEPQVIRTASGEISFEIEAGRKHGLLNGIDEIAASLTLVPAISAFEARRRLIGAWLPVIPTSVSADPL
jgi:3-isopropylmalate/(R)-2-methylmalate dehydratase small subunit